MAKRGRPAKWEAPEIGEVMGPEKMKDEDDTKYDDYMVKDAVDTVARAEAHKSDPKMVQKMGEHADKKIKSLKQLRKMAFKMGTVEKPKMG